MGSLGAVLVLLTAGLMVWEGLSVRGDQAILTVDVLEIVEVEGSWYVKVEVRNSGDVAAAEVLLEGTLAGTLDGTLDGTATTSSATLDFLPSQSTRSATLLFGVPPTKETLSLRAVSFVEP